MEEKEMEANIENLKSKITTMLEMDKLASMITNNTIEFEYKGVTYRATRPTFKQKQEANEHRITKFTELLKDEKYLMEDTLINMYLKKGIDIKDLDAKLKVLDKERQDYLFKLGQAIKDQKPNPELEQYKIEIQKLNDKIQELMMRRAVLMDTSLESQVSVFVYSYLTYLAVQKKEGENWIPSWSSYDEFMSADETLINLAVFYESFLSRVEL